MKISDLYLKEKLEKNLEATYVSAIDNSDGCGSKFSIIVVTPQFEGKSLLERQRAVYDCLKDEINQIHALQMKTWTPSQYEEKKLKSDHTS